MFAKFIYILVFLVPYFTLVTGNDDFTKFDELSKDKSEGERIKAIELIQGYANLQSTQRITNLLADEHPRVRHRAIKALAKLKDEKSIDWLCQTALKNSNDLIRLAVANVLGYLKDKKTITSLLNALKDKNPEVRAESAYSLGYIGDQNVFEELNSAYQKDSAWQLKASALESMVKLDSTKSLETIKKALTDKNYQVRMVALENILLLDKVEVIKALEKALSDIDWRIRVTAIEATQKIRTKECITFLIKQLASEKGRLKLDILIALKDLTGKEFGSDIKAWQKWWDANKESFNIPNKSDKKEEKSYDTKVIGDDTTSPKFYKVPILSQRIIFVLDLSGSMRDEVKDDDKKDDDKTTRLDIAKKEMTKTISELNQSVFFNIILLGSDKVGIYDKKQKIWIQRLVEASSQNKAEATNFTNKQVARGWTNIYDALVYAFEDENVDTVFLLSDGGASRGIFISNDEIVFHIKKLNKFKKIMIHAIETEPSKKGSKLMHELAEITKGLCIEAK